MKVKKEIARPGTYSYIHPKTGLPEKMTITADTVKHFLKQGNAMRAAGLSIPVPIEHQSDAKPMTEGEKAAWNTRNNAGWVDSYEVGEVKGKNGQTIKDVLFGNFDIQDADIAKKLPHTIKFTSPWINSFVDGSGKKWDGVVSHVALTTRPRIVDQVPFAPDMAAALSLVGQLSDKPFSAGNVGEGIALSRAGLVTKKADGSFAPEYPMAFSLAMGVPCKMKRRKRKKLTGARMSEEEREEEEVDDDYELGEDEEWADEEEEPQSPLEKVEPMEAMADDQGDVKTHEAICHLLKALGFNPPDQVDEKNIMRAIYETLMAKVQENGIQKAEEDATPDEPISAEEQAANTPLKDNNPIVQESPSMYASLEQVNKIKDPEKRAMAGAYFSLSQNILGGFKKGRDQRVERLYGRLPAGTKPGQRDWLRTKAAGCQLSMGLDGAVIDPLAETLDILEAGAVDMRATLAGAQEMEQPHDSGQRAKQVSEEVAGNLNLPKAG